VATARDGPSADNTRSRKSCEYAWPFRQTMTNLRIEPETYESQLRGVPEGQIAIRVRLKPL
jgi:hypothetical protein